MLLNKLTKISRNDEEKIAIVNNSIENNWKGFYGLKEDSSYQKSVQPEKKYDQNGYESEEEFMKMLEEDKGNDGEAFIKKVLDKAKEVKFEEISMEEIKQGLHKAIDNLETEKDLQRFCLRMGELVFEHFREKVIGDK